MTTRRIALALACCCSLAGASEQQRLEQALERVSRELRSGILDFWAAHAIDRERGGYITNLDESGRWAEDDKKYLLTQTRMVWVFARAHRHGIDDRGYLDLAEHGVRFLIDAMWDQQHGGFYWLVDGDGQVVKDGKSVYTQSFAIYALSEYHLASGDAEALDYAERLFDLFVTHAADEGLGFRERFTREWTQRDSTKSPTKTLDTHMHLMECFTTLYQASGKAVHRQALADLVELIVERCVDPEGGYAYSTFDRDFVPILREDGHTRTSYGHNVELAWLLLEALDALGRDREAYRAVVLALIDHAIENGQDEERGGLAMYGPLRGHVLAAEHLGEKRLLKSWWEQAEMLVATLEAYAWTGEARYLETFEQTMGWIWSHHVDPERGGWYGIVSWDGSEISDRNKGNGWKSAYHDGRALMLVEHRLRRLLAKR